MGAPWKYSKRKTLIINCSPNKYGHTGFLKNLLRTELEDEVDELFVYGAKIGPCMNCHHCEKENNCDFRDDMDKIYADDYDKIVIISSLYLSGFPAPFKAVLDRL
jgi:multimeric flavodoxin WrbA